MGLEFLIGVCILILVITILMVSVYRMEADTKNREKLFELQIQMAAAQTAMTKELPWSSLREIVNEIIGFTIDNYITNNGLNQLQEGQLSLSWTTILEEICSKVDLSIAPEMKRQILKTVTIQYFTEYIKNSVQLLLVYKLTTNKEKSNTVNNKITSIQNNIRESNTNSNRNNVKEINKK